MTIQKEDTEHTVQKKTSLKNPANHNAKAAFVILPLAPSKGAIREGEKREGEKWKREESKITKKKKKEVKGKSERRKNKGKGEENKRREEEGERKRE